MKICSFCKTQKPFSEFAKNKSTKDGYQGRCKCCNKLDRKSADVTKAYNKAYYLANKARIQAATINYYYSNKQNMAQRKKEYAANNQEKVRAWSKTAKVKRRTSERQVKITSLELRQWTSEQIKVCVYCGQSCQTDYHIDHIDPLSAGGTHTLNNLTIACKTCNLSKATKSLIVWLAHRQRLK